MRGGPGGAGLLQRSPGSHRLHLLFAERLMLSNKQLMLRPSCQPEWEERKPLRVAFAKGNGRNPIHGLEEGAPALGDRSQLPRARGGLGSPKVWVRLGIHHSKGTGKKWGDPEPLRSANSSRAVPLAQR